MRLSVEAILRHLAWIGPVLVLAAALVLRLLRQFIKPDSRPPAPPAPVSTASLPDPDLDLPGRAYLHAVVVQAQQAGATRAVAPNQHVTSL